MPSVADRTWGGSVSRILTRAVTGLLVIDLPGQRGNDYLEAVEPSSHFCSRRTDLIIRFAVSFFDMSPATGAGLIRNGLFVLG